MQVIYKYPLPYTVNTIEVSLGAKILHIGLQNEQPYAWILCDPDSEFKEKRYIEAFFTGEFSEKLSSSTYLTTMLNGDSFLVFHWFETTNFYRKQNNKSGE